MAHQQYHSLRTTSQTATSAAWAWSIYSASPYTQPATALRFYWRNWTDGGAWNSVALPTTTTSYNTAGLTTNKVYEAYLLVSFSDGESVPRGRCVSLGTQLAQADIKLTAAWAVTQTTISFGCEVYQDGGSTVTERGVIYCLKSQSLFPVSGGTGTVKVPIGSGLGDYSVSITGLTPNTEYAFRPYAINSSGINYFPEDYPFNQIVYKTSPTQDSLYVTNLAVTQTGKTYMDVSWVSPSNSDSLLFQILTPTAGNSTGWLSSNESAKIQCTPNKSGSFRWTNYYGSTYYYGTAVTYTFANLFDNPVLFQSDYTSTSITFSWINDEELQDGVWWNVYEIQEYIGSSWVKKWGYTGNTTYISGRTQQVTSGAVTFAAGHQGTYRLMNKYYRQNQQIYDIVNTNPAITGVGLLGNTGTAADYCNPVYSNTITAYASGVTPTLTTTAISDITETSATGGGTISSAGSTPMTDMGICWSASPNPTTGDSYYSNGSGMTGSFVSFMTGLTGGTLYYVRSYAVNESGIAYGSAQTFYTTDTNAYAPTGLTYSNSTCNGFDLQWVNNGVNQGTIDVFWYPTTGGTIILDTLTTGSTATTISSLWTSNDAFTVSVRNNYSGNTSTSINAYTSEVILPTGITGTLITDCHIEFTWNNDACTPDSILLQNQGSWITIATLDGTATGYTYTGTPVSNVFRLVYVINGVEYYSDSFISEVPPSVSSVTVRNAQCQPFDSSAGRIIYNLDYLISGHSYTLTLFKSDLSTYTIETGLTSSDTFYVDNVPPDCYFAQIKDETCNCIVDVIKYCVESLTPFSLGGVKKLWIAKWSDDIDYNYWKTSDENYFLEFEDASFFNSTKIKEYLSHSGGTIQWYSIPVLPKVCRLSQKLSKVRQGFILTDTLEIAIPKANAEKWTKIADIINPENKWIGILIDADDFAWTFGYRHGARITAYNYKTGTREEDNGYTLTFTAVSENKLLTSIDKNYITNNV